MKKRSIVTLTLLFAFAFSWFVAPAIAQEHAVALNNPQVVKLGDGAPIPYFNVFESELLTGAEAIAGITGAVQGNFIQRFQDAQGEHAIEGALQNLMLTDDVLALFFTLRLDGDFQAEAGDMQYGKNWAIKVPPVFVNGKHLETLNINFLREGHLLDARTLACIGVMSLEKPLADGQVLTIGPEFDEEKNQYVGGIPVVVNRNAAKDPTIGYTPMQVATQSFSYVKGGRNEEYQYVVERVAKTPFGNRILINFRDIGGTTACMPMQIIDATANVLPVFSATYTSHSEASREHPQQMRNEVWFYGGLDSDTLRIMPEQDIPVKYHSNTMKTAYVSLDSLPIRVKLDNGSALTITAVSVTKDGFLVEYLPEGHTGYLEFDLANAQNQQLNLNFVSFDETTPVKERLMSGGYWSREYKDRIVSAVTQKDLDQIKTLSIDYRMGESRLLEDMAVKINLK